jgi:hypothetical protein
MIIRCLIAAGAISLGSCASPYGVIKDIPDFSDKTTVQHVDVSFQHDLLRKTGNRKYARRASRKDISVVAVKIVNRSGKTLVPGENLFFTSDGERVDLIDTKRLFRKTRQSVFIHLLYLPLTFIFIADGDVLVPIGIFIGPPLAGANMVIAAISNDLYRDALRKFELVGKPVSPNSIAIGIIGLRRKKLGVLSIDLQ